MRTNIPGCYSILAILGLLLLPPSPAIGSSMDFEFAWGTHGSAPGQFDSPEGIAVDDMGAVYVADVANDRIQVFASDSTFLRSWGEHGGGSGHFDLPHGVAVKGGYVYVADYRNGLIQKFTTAGGFVTQWSGGTPDGQLRSPVAVAVDSDNNVYAVEYVGCRIQKFDENGVFSLSWGYYGTGQGAFHAPRGICIGPDDSIYITDHHNNRVQKFRPDSTFVLEWATESGPYAIAFDTQHGCVYVTSTARHNVTAYNSEGAFRFKWGQPGQGEGEFDGPAGVATHGGHVYVVDYDNSRIQKFMPACTPVQNTTWGRVKAMYSW